MIQTVLDNAAEMDNVYPVLYHQGVDLIWTVLDNAAEMDNVYPVLYHQDVDLIQTVLDNAAEMVCAHHVKSCAYRVRTEHAEATVVVLVENVKRLLNAVRVSAACTCLLLKLCFNFIHTISKTSYSVGIAVKDTAWMIVVVQKDNSVQKKDDVNQ